MAKLFMVACLLLVAASIRAGEVTEGTAPTPKKSIVTEEHAGQAERDKLLDDLFTNYRRDSYPDNVIVKFGVTLLDANLDQEKNALETSVFLTYVWTDPRLMWNEKKRGVKVLRVPPSKVWLPDITLYNSKDRRQACLDSNALVYPNGDVVWLPPCQLTSSCSLTLDKYPYGEQVCTLKFGSWSYDGFTMGLEFYNNETQFHVSDFSGSPTYEITQNSAVRNERIYDCCVDPYIDLTWTLGLKKTDPSADKTCNVKY